MKSYMILVEAEEFVGIEAESEEEAMELAIDQFTADKIKASIVHTEDYEEDD